MNSRKHVKRLIESKSGRRAISKDTKETQPGAAQEGPTGKTHPHASTHHGAHRGARTLQSLQSGRENLLVALCIWGGFPNQTKLEGPRVVFQGSFSFLKLHGKKCAPLSSRSQERATVIVRI